VHPTGFATRLVNEVDYENAAQRAAVRNMAGPTRLELATSGVTGLRSNQLNYDPASVWPELVGGGGFEPTTPCV
jgi:hypothetical protein